MQLEGEQDQQQSSSLHSSKFDGATERTISDINATSNKPVVIVSTPNEDTPSPTARHRKVISVKAKITDFGAR